MEEGEGSVVDPQWIQCGSGSRNCLYKDLDTGNQINADPDSGQTCCKSQVEFFHENIQYLHFTLGKRSETQKHKVPLTRRQETNFIC
jgi:hypothetical protein